MLRLSPGNSIYSGVLFFRDMVSNRRFRVSAAYDIYYQELIFAFQGNVFIYNLNQEDFTYSKSGSIFKSLTDIKVSEVKTKGECILDFSFDLMLYKGVKSRIYRVKGILKPYKKSTQVSEPIRFEYG